MTATEKLRKLLDGRGVEWYEPVQMEATLGRSSYTYEQWREISDAVADAMEYAHDRAIEHPDKADPIWNLDEYVSRILKVAFEGEATLGRGECREVVIDRFFRGCGECGYMWEYMYSIGKRVRPNFCPNCGRKVIDK